MQCGQAEIQDDFVELVVGPDGDVRFRVQVLGHLTVIAHGQS